MKVTSEVQVTLDVTVDLDEVIKSAYETLVSEGFSDEFFLKDVDDDEFVDIVYEACSFAHWCEVWDQLPSQSAVAVIDSDCNDLYKEVPAKYINRLGMMYVEEMKAYHLKLDGDVVDLAGSNWD